MKKIQTKFQEDTVHSSILKRVTIHLKRASSKIQSLISDLEEISKDGELLQINLEEFFQLEVTNILGCLSFASKAINFDKIDEILFEMMPKYWKEALYYSLSKKGISILNFSTEFKNIKQ